MTGWMPETEVLSQATGLSRGTCSNAGGNSDKGGIYITRTLPYIVQTL